jgi:hypothetical protein
LIGDLTQAIATDSLLGDRDVHRKAATASRFTADVHVNANWYVTDAA